MKKITFFLVFAFLFVNIYSQNDSLSKINANIRIGIKYTPIDYIGGNTSGIVFSWNKIHFGIKNDFNISMAKDSSSTYFNIDKYRIFNYFDIGYNFYKNSFLSFGYGWVSNKNVIHRFNKEYGYYVFSICFTQKLSKNILAEIRGDIPLKKQNPTIDNNIAFPMSISILYELQ